MDTIFGGSWPAPLANKVVPLRFMGAELSLALSQALFSSHDIDSGSKLLLKALARELDAGRLPVPATALDIGCGTGVIGLALAAALPGLAVTAQDRDALALDFTLANARANGLSGRVAARPGLLMDIGAEERFDLIVTNIPAKAGSRALDDFFARSPSHLKPGGSIWVVIVDTLSRAAVSSILRAGHELFLDEAGKEHSVLAFRPRAAAPLRSPIDRLSPYDRGTFPFALCDAEYSIRSVYGVEDFDLPSYGLKLDAHVLSRLAESGRLYDPAGGRSASVLAWGPGQGHLPVILSRLMPGASIHLAGRDLLELLASERALADSGAREAAGSHHLGSPLALPGKIQEGSLDLAFFHPDLCSGHDWSLEVLEAGRVLLRAEGILIVQSESSALSILDRRKPDGFRPLADKREKGRRAIAWRKVAE